MALVRFFNFTPSWLKEVSIITFCGLSIAIFWSLLLPTLLPTPTTSTWTPFDCNQHWKHQIKIEQGSERSVTLERHVQEQYNYFGHTFPLPWRANLHGDKKDFLLLFKGLQRMFQNEKLGKRSQKFTALISAHLNFWGMVVFVAGVSKNSGKYDRYNTSRSTKQ